MSALKLTQIERAEACLVEFQENSRCLIYGPFWLYPDGSGGVLAKLELGVISDGVDLAYIESIVKRQGVGSKVLRELCESADRHQALIKLRVDPKHGTPKKVLEKFYKSFGFEKDKYGNMKRVPASCAGGENG